MSHDNHEDTKTLSTFFFVSLCSKFQSIRLESVRSLENLPILSWQCILTTGAKANDCCIKRIWIERYWRCGSACFVHPTERIVWRNSLTESTLKMVFNWAGWLTHWWKLSTFTNRGNWRRFNRLPNRFLAKIACQDLWWIWNQSGLWISAASDVLPFTH